MDWKKEERSLDDWTLRELKNYCKERIKDSAKHCRFECAGCQFNHVVCGTSPDRWILLKVNGND